MKDLSKGNKQKVSLICALMNKPNLLILDGPTSGLDSVLQEVLKNLI
ncbi:ATP-binding cassette domain-containing protein [Spiroplasma gladiatoris]